MDIGWAVTAMERGERVRREGWRPPRGWWVAIAFPADGRTVTDWPFFIKHWTDGTVAWAPTHADLLAKDWEPDPFTPEEIADESTPPQETEAPAKGWGGIR